MITANGYSNQPGIMPEGICITFGRAMFEDHGGAATFLRRFEHTMATEGNYWLHKLKNKPTIEVDHVYIIAMNRLYGRVFYGGYEKGEQWILTATYERRFISWPRIILAGPIEKPSFKRELRGFQGFRYATKLF